MNPLVKNLAAVTTLATTALLLVADSPPERQCLHPEQRLEFAVSGTCGPEGTLHVHRLQDACEVYVEGAEALNLPGFGFFPSEVDTVEDQERYDLRAGRWVLQGSKPERWLGQGGGQPEPVDGGAPDAGASAQYFHLECEATREGSQVKLSCEELGPDGSVDPVLATCEALLTPR